MSRALIGTPIHSCLSQKAMSSMIEEPAAADWSSREPWPCCSPGSRTASHEQDPDDEAAQRCRVSHACVLATVVSVAPLL